MLPLKYPALLTNMNDQSEVVRIQSKILSWKIDGYLSKCVEEEYTEKKLPITEKIDPKSLCKDMF